MDLKRKLARLTSVGESVAAPWPADAAVVVAAPAALASDRAARLQQLRAGIAAVVNREASRPRRNVRAPLYRDLPAASRDTPLGPLYVRERRYALDHHHGTSAVGTCLLAAGADIAKLAFDAVLADVDPARLVFFDLETTGLAGGTGTLAFLIGLGFFAGGGLCVEQLFLARPGEEGPMLAHVAERLAGASALVSFNGKSFDWPLLRTRFVLNRVPVPSPPPHVDLLHCARRVFRLRLAQMRLGTIEREVLGFDRPEDIDGAFIPATYFAFLRDGDGAPLEPVFTHNAHDLVALAALYGRLAHMLATSPGNDDPRDHLGLAHVAARAGDHERALSFAHAAVDHPSGRFCVAGLRLAASVHRRRGQHAAAAELLARALVAAPTGSNDAAEISLQLAKLYERPLRDPAQALTYASTTVPAEDSDSQQRRVARLHRRMARQQGR